MTITIESGVWGGAVDENVLRVFQSVENTFQSVGIVVSDPIYVLRSGNGPMIQIGRGANNSHLVRISEMQTRWDQYAYQFAHEFCHIFSEHELVPLGSRFGWWEEAICELSSIWCLNEMAREWSVNAPYSNWNSYSTSLKKYAENDLANTTAFTDSESFRNWLEPRLAMMHKKRYMRKSNKVVSKQLLPVVNLNPDKFWRAVTEMNAIAFIDASFVEYLGSWQGSSSEQSTVKKITEKLGY